MIVTEFSVSVFINPILRKLDSRAQASAISLFAKRLGTAMPFWYAASLLLLIGQPVLRRQKSADAPLLAACAIWAAVIIHTLLVLVPINNRMMKLDSSAFSPEQQREHKKWDNLHRIRVAALTASMVCCLVAIGM